jgi:hypothetical protein
MVDLMREVTIPEVTVMRGCTMAGQLLAQDRLDNVLQRSMYIVTYLQLRIYVWETKDMLMTKNKRLFRCPTPIRTTTCKLKENNNRPPSPEIKTPVDEIDHASK